jgi:hypothetical protein
MINAITAASNLAALFTVMKFDGDIDLSIHSHNQCHKMGEDGDLELWYVGLESDVYNIEAFVIASPGGNFSYFDCASERSLVIDNVVVQERCTEDEEAYIEGVVTAYQIDGSSFTRPAKAGALQAYYAALKAVADGSYRGS